MDQEEKNKYKQWEVICAQEIDNISTSEYWSTPTEFSDSAGGQADKTTQIIFGLMNFSFGVVLLFTLVPPYPRFPFIFISGYPFWSAVLFINSGAFLIGMKRKTTRTLMLTSRIMNTLSALGATAGIVLLSFGFILDRHYLCGFSEGASECHGITTLFFGILIMLMAFTIIELIISSSFSVLATHSIRCECEQ